MPIYLQTVNIIFTLQQQNRVVTLEIMWPTKDIYIYTYYLALYSRGLPTLALEERQRMKQNVQI